MIVTDAGPYVTMDGNLAMVAKTDGYRRCYGHMVDRPDEEMSWYVECGSVRAGDVRGPRYNNALSHPLEDEVDAIQS